MYELHAVSPDIDEWKRGMKRTSELAGAAPWRRRTSKWGAAAAKRSGCMVCVTEEMDSAGAPDLPDLQQGWGLGRVSWLWPCTLPSSSLA